MEPNEATTGNELTGDDHLGTAAMLLMRRGDVATAVLLTSVERVNWDWDHDDWGKSYHNVIMIVPFELIDSFSDEVLYVIQEALNDVGRGYDSLVSAVKIAPSPVTGDWRAAVRDGLNGGVSNQGMLAPRKPTNPTIDGMHFRDKAELAVYEELKRQQSELPANETIAIFPNCSVLVPGHTWEPDFLVTCNNRAGIIEVDGVSHNRKRESDRSRDRVLEDAGLRRPLRRRRVRGR